MIPRGYQLQITSWENDGDYYNTQIVNGLTASQAAFYVEFAELFGDSGIETGNCCDNEEVEWAKLYKAVLEICERYPNAFASFVYDNWINDLDKACRDALADPGDEEAEDEARTIIHEIAHELLDSSEFYVFRVFESAKIFYFPEDVNEVSLAVLKEAAAKV